MEAQAFGHEAEADHQQQAQAQDHHGGMARHETHQRAAGQHHHRHGDDHGDHHDAQVLHHAHGRDHRVQREYGVQHHDLQDHLPEHGMLRLLPGVRPAPPSRARAVPWCPLNSRNRPPSIRIRSRPEISAPSTVNRGWVSVTTQAMLAKQAQAHDHGQRQADHARAVALMRRQLVGQDGDEHQVVDAQHDFKNDQRRQAARRSGRTSSQRSSVVQIGSGGREARKGMAKP